MGFVAARSSCPNPEVPSCRGSSSPTGSVGTGLLLLAVGRFGKRSRLGKGDTGSTISTLLHDKINPKDCQVLSLGDSGFLQFFRVVSRDYGKPRDT